MTIMDKKLVLSAAQALTKATAGTIDSTNVIDIGNANPNIGRGTPLFAHCRVNTAFTGATGCAAAVAIKHSADNSTYYDLVTFDSTAVTGLTAGTKLIEQALPSNVKRYIKVVYTIATAACTAGKVDTWIDLSATEDV